MGRKQYFTEAAQAQQGGRLMARVAQVREVSGVAQTLRIARLGLREDERATTADLMHTMMDACFGVHTNYRVHVNLTCQQAVLWNEAQAALREVSRQWRTEGRHGSAAEQYETAAALLTASRQAVA